MKKEYAWTLMGISIIGIIMSPIFIASYTFLFIFWICKKYIPSISIWWSYVILFLLGISFFIKDTDSLHTLQSLGVLFFLAVLPFETIPDKIQNYFLSFPQNKNWNNIFWWITGSIFILGIFIKTFSLGSFYTVDEGKWIFSRVPEFVESFIENNEEQNITNDKPGVFISLISNIGLWDLYKEEKLSTAYWSKIRGTNEIEEIFFAGRLPIVIFTIFAIFIIGILLWNIFPPSIILISIAGLLFTPSLIGISQIINPDAFLWIGGISSVLLFFLFLKNTKSFFLFWATSFSIAFSLLAKFSATYLFLFLSIQVFLHIIYFIPKEQQTDFYKTIQKSLLSLIGGISLWIIIFFPYATQNPWYALEKSFFHPTILPFAIILLLAFIIPYKFYNILFITPFEKIKKYISSFLIIIFLLLGIYIYTIQKYSPHTYIDTFNYASSIKNLWNDGLYFLFFSIPSIFIIVIYIGGIIFLFKKKCLLYEYFITICISFILFYLGGASLTHHSTPINYQIINIPFIILLSAILFYNIFSKYIISLIIIIPLIIESVFFAYPFYLSFNNIFLIEGKLLFDGWGQGGYQASQFIREKEGIMESETKIYTNYTGFWQFTKAKTIDSISNENDYKNIDYYVFFTQCTQFSILSCSPWASFPNQKKFLYYLYEKPPIFELKRNNVPFIKIVEGEK